MGLSTPKNSNPIAPMALKTVIIFGRFFTNTSPQNP